MKNVVLQPAYVLHRKSYRESSLLVELFTQDYGRLSVIAKGVRKRGTSIHNLLQPFQPLLISWSGKSELKTLTNIEVKLESAFNNLQGDHLFAGFYLNELLMYLMQKWDAHPKLYRVYADTLIALQNHDAKLQQKILRIFEKRLLEEIGYGLLRTFLPEEHYRFVPEQGFVVVSKPLNDSDQQSVFLGKNLLAIAKEEWNDENLKDAKRLTRMILAPLLGARTIHSRQLFNVYEATHKLCKT